jgi:predicted nucleotidyltransferase
MVQKRDNKDMKILAHLFNGEAHIRGMEKAIRIPHATLVRKLSTMEKQDIVDYRAVGKNKQYFIKRNLKSRKMLEIMENYRLLEFLEKHHDMEPLFEDIAKKAGYGIVMLFGSYAKGIQKKGSDIDIYIETQDKGIKKTVESINSRLSVKTGKFDSSSLLIKEIIRNHVIIKGAERFYEQLFV